MRQLFRAISLTVFLTLIFNFLSSSREVFSQTKNFWLSGYQTRPFTTTNIDLSTKYGDCIRVSSANTYESFISTKSLEGWTSFKVETPPGLSYTPCVPGEWIYTLGQSFYTGNGNGEFAFIHGQSFTRDTAGNFYFYKMDGVPQIKKYSSTGSWVMTLGGGIGEGENNLSGTSAILRGGSYNDPDYMAVDEDQNIYVASKSKIKKYSSTGDYLFTIGSDTPGDDNDSGGGAGFRYIQGLAILEGDRLAVADQLGRKVKIYDASGNWITTIGKRYWDNQLSGTGAGIDLQANWPKKPYISSSDQIFFPSGNLDNLQIKSYSSTGIWLGDMSLPESSTSVFYMRNIDYMPNGDVYLAYDSWYTPTVIRRFSSTGVLLMTLGGSGTDITNPASGEDALVSSDFILDNSGSIIMTLGSVGGYIKKYDKYGNFVMSIGSGTSFTGGDNNLSGEDALLTQPRLLKVNPVDNSFYVLVNNCYNQWVNPDVTCKIKKYSSTGAWLMTLGSGTPGDNDLSGESAGFKDPLQEPWWGSYGYKDGITLDNSGNILISDYVNFKIKKYSSTGAWMLTIGSIDGDNNLSAASAQLRNASILTIDNNNNIYVQHDVGYVDYGHNPCKIKKYSSTGAWMLTLGSTCGNNNLSDTSARITRQEDSSQLMVDTDESMYVVTGDNASGFPWDPGKALIKKYSSTGAYLFTIGNSTYDDNNLSRENAGIGIAYYAVSYNIDASGSIYLFDSTNNKVKKYSSTGTWLLTIGTTHETNNLSGEDAVIFPQWSNNFMIQGNSSGEILIPTGGYSIHKYSSTGAFITSVGQSSLLRAYNYSGDNNLSGTAALFVSTTTPHMDNSGAIILVDDQNKKIKKYSSTGAWLLTIGSIEGDNTLSASSAEIKPEGSYPFGDRQNLLTIDAVNNITFFDNGNGKVKRYSPTGNYLDGYSPDYATKDENQSPWYSSSSLGNILSPINGGEVLLPEGDIWGVGWFSRLHRFTATGSYAGFIGTPAITASNKLSQREAFMPGSIWEQGFIPFIDSLGNVWLDYASEKVKYSFTGAYIMSFSGGIGYSPNYVDVFGNLYQYDANIEMMSKFSTTGALISSFGVSIPGVIFGFFDGSIWGDIDGDEEGNILISYINTNNYTTSMFRIYSSGGVLLGTLGADTTGDNDLSGTSARFSNIVATHFSQGIFSVLNTTSCRLKKYDYSGNLISIIGSNCTTADNLLSGELAGLSPQVDPMNLTSGDRVVNDLIVDHSGSVYIRQAWWGDTAPATYKKYSASGEYLYTIYPENNVNNFKINSLNQVLINDGPNGTLNLYSGNSNDILFHINEGVYGGSGPQYYLFDKYDRIYVLGADGILRKYSALGTPMSSIGTGINEDNDLSGTGAGLENPVNIMIDDFGYIYLATNERLKKYFPFSDFTDVGCEFTMNCTPQPCPECIVNEWIYSLGQDQFGGEQDGANSWLYGPNFTKDSAGNYYIVVASTAQVKKFSSTGAHMLTLGSPIFGGFQQTGNNLSGTSAILPFASYGYVNIVTDESQNIYIVLGAQYDTIKKYSSTGAYMMTIGGNYGDNDLSGTGAALANISELLYKSGSLYIRDQGGILVKKYSAVTGDWQLTIGDRYWKSTGSGPLTRFLNPTIVHVDSEKNMYINSNDSITASSSGMSSIIKKYSSTGAWLQDFESNYGLVDSFPDSEGNIYRIMTSYWVYWYASSNPGLLVKKYSATGTLIHTIGGGTVENNFVGGTGTFLSETNSPLTAYLDYNDGILFVQPNTFLVKRYTSTGAWLSTIGDGTEGDNNLSGTAAKLIYPNLRDVDNSGSVILVTGSYGEYKIKKYSLTGSWIMTLGDGTNGLGNNNDLSGEAAKYEWPGSLATDSENNIILNTGEFRVKKYSSTGTYMMTIGDGVYGDNNLSGVSARMGYVSNVYTDSSNNIYILVNNNRIKKYSSNGTWLMNLGGGYTSGDNNLSGDSAQFGYFTDFSVDESGTITFLDYEYQKLRRYSSTGAFIMAIGNGTISDNNLSGTGAGLYISSNYFDIDVNFIKDSSGSLYISDNENHKIKRYTSTGAWDMTLGATIETNDLSSTGAIIISPSLNPSLHVNNSGDIWVVGDRSVHKYTSTGAWLTSIGVGNVLRYLDDPDNNLSGTAALFGSAYPRGYNGITSGYLYSHLDNEDNIIISDYSNDKLKKYSSTGAWLLTIGSGIEGDNNLSGPLAELYNPFQVSSDSSKNIYILSATSTGSNIKKYSATGEYIDRSELSNASIYSLQFYDNGSYASLYGNDIWGVGYGSYFSEYTFTGQLILSMGQNSTHRPTSNRDATITANVTIDTFGNTWDLLGNDIAKYSTTGAYLRSYSGSVYYVDTAGTLSLYNSGTEIINKYNSSGSLVDTIDVSDTSLVPRIMYGESDDFLFVGFSPTINQYDITMVRVYDRNGNLLSTIGSENTGDNTLGGTSALFTYIQDIKVHNNIIYILDNQCKIKKYYLYGDYNGEVSITCATQNEGFTLDPNGSIIVHYIDGSYLYRGFRKYSSTGSLIFQSEDKYMPIVWGGSYRPISHIAGDGAIYYLGTGGVDKYSLLGVYSNNFITHSGATSMTIDTDGNIFLGYAGENMVRKFSQTGTLLSELGNGVLGDNDLSGTGAGLYYPIELRMDGQGYLYVFEGNINGWSNNIYLGRIKKYYPYSVPQ